MVFEHSSKFTGINKHESQHRVQGVVSTSNDDAKTHNAPMPEASKSNASDVAEFPVLFLEEEQEKLIEKLEARVKELKSTNAQAEEEALKEREKWERPMNCAVCLEPLQNPQLLECGHSLCHSCIRTWWETTDAEKGSFLTPETSGGWQREPFVLWTEGHGEGVGLVYDFPIPQPKLCPYCKTIVTRRPAPNPTLGTIVNIMQNHSQDTPRIPNQEDANEVDLWHGIFRSQIDIDDAKKNEVWNIRKELEEGLLRCHWEFQQLHQNLSRMTNLLPKVLQERNALRNQLESSQCQTRFPESTGGFLRRVHQRRLTKHW